MKYLSVLALLSTCAAAPASAQETMTLPINCLSAEQGRKILGNDYQEARRAVGSLDGGAVGSLDGGKNLMEIYVNEVTGTWSVIVVSPTGQMCLLANGKEYQTVDEPVILIPQGDLN